VQLLSLFSSKTDVFFIEKLLQKSFLFRQRKNKDLIPIILNPKMESLNLRN